VVNSLQQTLFIGGPRDGERSNDEFEFGYEKHSIKIVNHDGTVEYFPLLTLIDTSLADIFRMLLRGYHGKL
jgi:hypothetical protein